MTDTLHLPATREIAQQRRDLAPETQAAFDAFGRQVFAGGALSAKMKQIVAVAVAHVTQCPYCIKGHTKAALRSGATREELMEAIWRCGRDASWRGLRAFRAGDRHLRGVAGKAQGPASGISEVRVEQAYDHPALGGGVHTLVDQLWLRG